MPRVAPLRKVMTKREARIIKRLRGVAKMPIQTIAKVTERHKKTIYSVIKGKAKFAKRGPKEKLSKKDVTNLVKILRSMIKKAKARYEVTLTMPKKRAERRSDGASDGFNKKRAATRDVRGLCRNVCPMRSASDSWPKVQNQITIFYYQICK